MKNLQRIFMTLALMLGVVSLQAQGNDCDCPEPTEEDIVCVDLGGEILAFPSACLAECIGFEVVEGDCTIEDWDDQGDWEDEEWDNEIECDCEEPTEEDVVCVETPFGIEPFPSACIAACFGLEVVDGDCDFIDWDDQGDWGDEGEYDCDCPEPTEEDMVCVESGFGIVPFPSACLAECCGLEVVEGDCAMEDWEDYEDEWEDDDYDYGNDCDCEEPTEDDIVCIETDFGVVAFPSACLAECFGFEVVEGDCTIEDWEDQGDWGDEYDDDYGVDCDCEEPTEDDVVCVDTGFEILPFPSACIAECLGLEVVDGDCDFGDWDDQGDWDDEDIDDIFDCDCEEPTEEDMVCVDTGFEILPFPSACLAECFGLEVVEGGCDEFDDGSEFPMVAIEEASYEEGQLIGIEVFPNPANELVSITIEANGEGAASLQIYSITGQLMIDEQVGIASGTQRSQVSLTELPAGTYLVKVTDSKGNQQNETLVKTK
ncbi:MAG: T9SS type A sorting domain-containing protein [Flavobacteriales bacterium]|nr:T9SS type A sorting domain-containing protein [Flavobacteriales bacterium]